MTLEEYYNLKPTAIYPKTEFVDKIYNACIKEFGEGCVSRATVINWCNGSTKPQDSKFNKVLSKVTGIKESELFA